MGLGFHYLGFRIYLGFRFISGLGFIQGVPARSKQERILEVFGEQSALLVGVGGRALDMPPFAAVTVRLTP